MGIIQIHYGSDDDGENRNECKSIFETWAKIFHFDDFLNVWKAYRLFQE